MLDTIFGEIYTNTIIYVSSKSKLYNISLEISPNILLKSNMKNKIFEIQVHIETKENYFFPTPHLCEGNDWVQTDNGIRFTDSHIRYIEKIDKQYGIENMYYTVGYYYKAIPQELYQSKSISI